MTRSSTLARLALIGSIVLAIGLVYSFIFSKPRAAPSRTTTQTVTPSTPPRATSTQHSPRPQSTIQLYITLPDGLDLATMRGIVRFTPLTESQRADAGQAGRLPIIEEDFAADRSEIEIPKPPQGRQLTLASVPIAGEYRIFLWDASYQSATARIPCSLADAGNGVLAVGNLELTPPTALLLLLTNPLPEQSEYFLRLRRPGPPREDEAETLQRLYIMKAGDRLIEAYDWSAEARNAPPRPGPDSSWPINTSEQNLIIPLFPDPSVQLVLATASGAQSAPLDIPLRAREQNRINVDVAELFSATAADYVELRGHLIYEGTGAPVVNATIERMEAPYDQKSTTRMDGSFAFPFIPLGKTTPFRVTVDSPADGRPMTALERQFQFIPPAIEPPAPVAHVTWQMPVYRWLSVQVSAEADRQLRIESIGGYPVYTVQQRQAGPGDWTDLSNTEIALDAAGFSAPVSQPGRYRAAVALSPLRIITSNETEFNTTDSSQTVALAAEPSPGRMIRIIVRQESNGYPIEGLNFTVRGTKAPGQPLRVKTDAQGTVDVGPVNTPNLYIGIDDLRTRQEFEYHIAALDPPIIEITLKGE